MKLESGNFCPLIGDECKGLECKFFVALRGKNPNTGENVDEWDCSIKWLPMLMIENSSQTSKTTAAIESFRNEQSRAADANVRILEAVANIYAATAQNIVPPTSNLKYIPEENK